ncbi:hypothetical protein FBY39_0363 [Microbacterium sp. SLBN-146]|nr:hypothetical protein FBY39_0363 [Microbacterium sp. SLBN-146]
MAIPDAAHDAARMLDVLDRGGVGIVPLELVAPAGVAA